MPKASMDWLAQAQQVPKEICVDNGPEFIRMFASDVCISRALDEWAHRNGVKLMFSRPGTPADNAHIESFINHSSTQGCGRSA